MQKKSMSINRNDMFFEKVDSWLEEKHSKEWGITQISLIMDGD